MSVAERDPAETVTYFLRLVEERRLGEASRYLAPGAEIIFPGGRRFANLEEQVAASRDRYRHIRKVFHRIDTVESDRSVAVYVYGYLEGEDRGGRRISSVRFIDRLELVDGLVVEHQVWNDLADLLIQRDAEDDG